MGREVVWKEGQKIKRTGEKRRDHVKGDEKYDNSNNNNNHTNDNNNDNNNSNNNNNKNYNSKWNDWIKKYNILLAGKISFGLDKISSESPALPHICRKLETERSLLPILGSLQRYNWNSWEQKQIIEQY